MLVLGTAGRARGASGGARRHAEKRNRKQPLILDHVGDMAYKTGRDVEFQTRFFEMYESTLRNKVCWPTMGNHEGATSSGRRGLGRLRAYVVPTRGETGGVPSGNEA